MRKRAPPGTFLLRFSETRIQCFVIAYVRDDQCVQFVPVTWQWFFFPQTPKGVAFTLHNQVQKEAQA
ncbi:unnamed protein product [Peronospora destructor]|uniref:SH2 domain-containing protein n=1 Tax=Peronospora destructor TaxID=86335 RepID=A0AAV0VAV6_9STRA|nr:unnamed protein product [Peronospora destructor]